MADKRIPRTILTVVVVGILALTGIASAQQQAEVTGTVRDPDGLALPGATLTFTEQGTGFTRTVVSAGNGSYIVPSLNPGTYDIEVTMQGFQTIRVTGFELTSGTEATRDFELGLATIEEVVTVTGESPLIEVTSNKLGGTLSGKEIDETPSNFRNFTALTQLVPGMTPSPATSTFEGGQVSANGATAWSNVYQMDGAYNNDDRLGGSQGTQVRMVLDIISEYQVLANQYAAEFGGGGGAIINMVTRSGTNDFSGRAYGYFRDDALNARSPFLEADEPKPDQRTLQAGFGVGGPIVRDKAHFYFNYERDEEELGGIKRFPAVAAPLAVDQIGYFTVDANNYFLRGDYQANPNNILSGRWVRETAPALGEGFNNSIETEDAKAFEKDFDEIYNVSWTSIVGDYGSNVVRFGYIRENLGSGNRTFFTDEPEYIGFNGRSQFALGSQNEHPSYITGTGGEGGLTQVRTFTLSDSFSYFKPDWNGDHNFKVGGGYSRNHLDPRSLASSGFFIFESDLPFNPANPASYPEQFEITLGPATGGDFETVSKDWRAFFFVQDKWQYNDKLTLNLGLRYDAQGYTPASRDDFAPRLGFAYDLGGDGTTVIRGGLGRFSDYTRARLDIRLQQRGVLTEFPAIAITDPNSPVLQPDLTTDTAGNLGIATLSAEGQAELERLRDQVLAGENFSSEPWVDDPDRQMPYMWSWSFGVAHQLTNDVAVNVDYVGNVSRDQLGLVDINEPLVFGDPDSRPGVEVFDPEGILIPAQARGVNFRRVLQYTTREEFNGDYQSLQVGVTKRFSNRFSLRNAYTLQRTNYVGLSYPENRRVWLDNDIRADYGRSEFDRTHVLSVSGTWNIWEGLNLAGIFSASSGEPINETMGVDINQDRDRNDRPVAGLVDGIVSDLDGDVAEINDISGENFYELNISLRYNFELGQGYSLGLYWDGYNITNNENLLNPTGNRASANFLVPTSTNFPRQMQFGARFQF